MCVCVCVCMCVRVWVLANTKFQIDTRNDNRFDISL